MPQLQNVLAVVPPRCHTSLALHAAEGFRLLGYEVVRITDPESVPEFVDDQTIVVGTIQAVHAALTKLGKTIPSQMDYPPALASWFNRTIERSTLGAVRAHFSSTEEMARGLPLFMKPATDIKAFPGVVVSVFRDMLTSSTLPNDFPVWTSEVVPFKSEFRCFVLRGEVLSCRSYKGDSLLFPYRRDVEEMVAAWTTAPVAYCLDVGQAAFPLPNDGGYGLWTTLVEVNDAHSAGHYGLDPLVYARWLEARWCELTGAEPVP